jgi:undecaprenyl-diphosphatase
MTTVDALLLGAVQGATEFLPISSSGHLQLAQTLLDAQPPSIFFDISLHLGTLIAVLFVFRRDVTAILRDLIPATGSGPWLQRRGVRQAGLLAIATAPTAIIGLLLDGVIEEHSSTTLVGTLLWVNGVILLSLKRYQGSGLDADPENWNISIAVALLIGTAQGIGVLPGISRSGITIVTALFCGIAWRPAAVFSFLVSIPAILGAFVLKIPDAATLDPSQTVGVVLGTAAALIVGVGCLHLVLVVMQRARLHHFSWYCFGVGAVALAMSI